MELAFQLWQARDAEADRILLLHGLGGTGALWRPISASLEDHYTLLAPDQRGHGGSRGEAKSYSSLEMKPDRMGLDILETMEALLFHPAWAIGHSMGVRTAVSAASQRPKWFSGLILVDLGLADSSVAGNGLELARFLERLPERFPSRAEARAFMTANCPDSSIGQYLMAVSVVEPDGGLVFPFDREALIRIIGLAQDASLLKDVRKLASSGMPILLLRGEKSQVWSKEAYEAERLSLGDHPAIRFEEVPGTGHGLPFEKRLEFVKRVREFIGAHSGDSNH